MNRDRVTNGPGGPCIERDDSGDSAPVVAVCSRCGAACETYECELAELCLEHLEMQVQEEQ